MGEKRLAEEGEILGGDRPGKLLHENIAVGDEEVENQPSNVSHQDTRKQAMIAAAVAREKAHKQKMTLSKRKKTSSIAIKQPAPNSQQASHVPLSEQAKKAVKQTKADEGSHNGWSPYETSLMTSGQARTATVVKKHGTIQNNANGRSNTSSNKKVKDAVAVSKNASSSPPPAPFLPQSVSPQFENAYTVFVSSNEPTVVKSSIAIMYKLIVNATTKGQDLSSTEDASKFRKVRLSNEKIQKFITNVNGGLDMMQAVGFQLAEHNGETYLVYPPGESGPDWLPESLEAMQQYGSQQQQS